jgi:hypothetical protein
MVLLLLLLTMPKYFFSFLFLLSINSYSQDLLKDFSLTPNSTVKLPNGITFQSTPARTLELLIRKSVEAGIDFSNSDRVNCISWKPGARSELSGIMFNATDTVGFIDGQLYVSDRGRQQDLPLHEVGHFLTGSTWPVNWRSLM